MVVTVGDPSTMETTGNCSCWRSLRLDVSNSYEVQLFHDQRQTLTPAQVHSGIVEQVG